MLKKCNETGLVLGPFSTGHFCAIMILLVGKQKVNSVRRRNARGGISRTVSVYLDEDTNNRLIRAKDRSGRSKTIEVQIRLRDHLKRFPDFYNEEIFREVIEENESTFKEL